MLAFALREIYERHGKRDRWTGAEYETIVTGADGLTPLEHAVLRRAGEVIDEANPTPDDLKSLKHAFIPALVQVSAEGEYLRRPARLAELPQAAKPLLDHLINARLLTTRNDGAGTVMVEVAHEALLRKWPLLRGWLDEEREFLFWKAQLGLQRQTWQRRDGEDGYEWLLLQDQLHRALRQLKRRPNAFTEDEKAYIRLSDRWQEIYFGRRNLSGIPQVGFILLALILSATATYFINRAAAILFPEFTALLASDDVGFFLMYILPFMLINICALTYFMDSRKARKRESRQQELDMRLAYQKAKDPGQLDFIDRAAAALTGLGSEIRHP